jgi:peptide/nickel transport system permease protein
MALFSVIKWTCFQLTKTAKGQTVVDQLTPKQLDIALELIKASKLRDAAALLAQIIQRDPDNERAWHMLSFAVADREKRLYALQRVLQINPGNRAAKSQLARISAAPVAKRPRRTRSAVVTAHANGDRIARRQAPGTFSRVAKYAVVRATVLLLMVAVGIYLAILVMNYGGYIDQIFRAKIDEAMNLMSFGMRDLSESEKLQAFEQARWAMEEAYGLHEPFLTRCTRWWYQALTFDWGKARFLWVERGSSDVRDDVGSIILDCLPNTLLLAGTANLLIFFANISLALFLSRKHGSVLDRVIITLSPISSIPNWVYGIILTVLIAGELHLLPFGGMFDTFPPAHKIGYVPIVLKHMILPVAAIFLSMFFQTVYTWRTFFLIHAGEDYVEMARAQGLPSRMIERRYILKPVLPYLMTSFAMMLLNFWQGILVLELFFRWPGAGRLFIEAVQRNERGVSVGLIVVFALLLAISVFLLDILYALVDPRVRLGSESQTVRLIRTRKKSLRSWLPSKRVPLRPRPISSRPTSVVGTVKQESTGPSSWALALWRTWCRLQPAFRQVTRYPSAIVGVLIILVLIAVSIYTVVAIPYPVAVQRWLPETAEKYRLPKNAMPSWINLFRKDDLPRTIIQDSRNGTATKIVQPGSKGVTEEMISFTIDYPYGGFPQDLVLRFGAQYNEKRPFVSLIWETPDGRQFDLGSFSIVPFQSWLASQDIPSRYTKSGPIRQVISAGGQGGDPAIQVLFADPAAEEPIPLKGTYSLRIEGLCFEQGSDLDAELVLYGQVYGLAGTDHMRRDLMVALLWGMPVALAFGFLGAIATSIISMIIAAFGAWFGGLVDGFIQRLTEVNMILPALPMAIMVFYLYSHSIWAILGVMVLLSIFGGTIKNYRAAFLQVKESPYIEAAQAYGASHMRIVRHYLVPRILPLLIPQLVFLIPTYVFFEATLAFLGIADPVLPTWGKVVYDALTSGAYEGHYYWILEPVGLMMLTALGFAMVGFALDSILNPRLRNT